MGWYWDFDDPSTAPSDTSNLQNPRHMFSAMGTYDVQLIVTDQNGCQDTTLQTLQVQDSPTSAFRFQQACEPAGLVYFTDSSYAGLSGEPIVEWLWELEPGYFSSAVNPQYTYAITDSCYQVNLTVTDAHGCRNTTTRQVCVKDQLSVQLTGTEVCQGDRTFLAASFQPAGDSIVDYAWDFGDGTPILHTTADTIGHLYTTPGAYLVEVTVTNADGCESSSFEEVRVNALPAPDFAATLAKCDEPTVFTDLSTAPGSVITGWLWDFGDGSFSVQQSPSHTYGPEDTTYTVTLTLTNAKGCIDSIQKQVAKRVCVLAVFEPSSQALCNGHDVCFADQSYVYGDEYPLTRWVWDFGDGTQESYTSYRDSICHVYDQMGTYEVTLVVAALVNGIENYDTTRRQVQVVSSPSSAFASSRPCIASGTQFTDLSQGHGTIITGWSWDFGDQASSSDTSSQQDPTYSYQQAGTYTVRLVTVNSYGCTDTLSQQVEIFELPEVDFSYSLACAGKQTRFTDETVAAQAPFGYWSWNFGDAGSTTDTSNLQNPGYVYDDAGNYTVQLRVRDENTCEDESSQVIQVYPTPVSDFNTVPNYGGIAGQVLCENLSEGAILYAWDFGNGETSELESPTVVYEQNGTYLIQLISTNEYQCADTVYREYDLILQGLYVPTAFVPEGDNPELREFKPVGMGLKSYLIEVFNQWGTLVWSSTRLDKQGSPAEGWDGTYNGTLLPVGDYVWSINAEFTTGYQWQGSDAGDGNTRTMGTVTLIR